MAVDEAAHRGRHPPPWRFTRRGLLGLAAGSVVSVAGCLEVASLAPPYETREIDDGACFEPVLQVERPQAFSADERVITTFLVRVEKERPDPSDDIWVQLSIGDRTGRFSGN